MEYKVLTHKYFPTDIADIISNKNNIKILDNWIKNFKNNKYSSAIISGNIGIGKTIITKMILNKNNYIVKIINSNTLKSYKTNDDLKDFYDFQYSVTALNNSDKKIALIFDSTEDISLISEKKYILDIHKYNNKKKMFPLLFITSNRHSKLLYELKKDSDILIFIPPTQGQLYNYTKKILISENINVYTDKIINDIIEFSQNDIRKLLNIIQDIKLNKISIDNFDLFLETSNKKNLDIGLFESTEYTLNNYVNFSKIMAMYQYEKVLFPLMLHENYIKKLNFKNSKKKLLNVLKNISNTLSKADNIETSIYIDQNWYLQNIHGFLSCIKTSYYINEYSTKNIELKDIRFSIDLNKTSLKNINRKNIYNFQKYSGIKDIHEILLLSKVFNNESLCNKVIKNNFITSNNIKLFSKIDKTIQLE